MAKRSRVQQLKELQLKESVARRYFWFMVIGVPLAVFISVLSMIMAIISVSGKKDVDVYEIVTDRGKAEFWAQNCLQGILLGSVQTMQDCSSAPGTPKLEKPKYPPLVKSLNTLTGTWSAADDFEGVGQWTFDIAATIVPTGGSAVRPIYQLNFVEKDGAYTLVSWPRIVAPTTTPITVNTVYTQEVDPSSAMFKTLTNFSNAWLVPKNNGQIPGYVSSNFTDKPPTASPYTSVMVLNVLIRDNYDPDNVKVGNVYEALVTVKASMTKDVRTSDTFHILQLPVKVVATDNGQWIVDGFSEPIDYYNVTPK